MVSVDMFRKHTGIYRMEWTSHNPPPEATTTPLRTSVHTQPHQSPRDVKKKKTTFFAVLCAEFG